MGNANQTKAVVVTKLTNHKDLVVSETDPPEAEPGELVIDVVAAGCNCFETLIVSGRYQLRPELPLSSRGEVAGKIAQVGDGVEDFAAGDRVMAHVEYGGFAERVIAPPAGTFRIPDEIPFEQVAA